MQINRPISNEIIARLNTNNFTMEPVGGIVLASFAGFTTMMTSMLISQNIVIGMLGLFGGMAFVFLKKSGRAEYLLTENGIYQFMSPFVKGALGFKPISRFFPFQSIHNYRFQEDMDRSLQQYNKLSLSLSVAPNKIILTNKKNPDQFIQFINEFKKLVEQTNETAAAPNSTGPKIDQPTQPHIIKKKRSFYKTPFAKVLAIFFLAMTIGLMYLGFTGVLNGRNSFRLYALVIPGTIFMVWKSFGKSKDSE